MKYLPLNPQLFVENRQRLIRELPPHTIAIFNANDEVISNGDAVYPFVQNSDLIWMTGIEQEETRLILFPDNPDEKHREVLVLVRPNELKEKWTGHQLRKEEGSLISGIEKVIWLDELPGLLQMWMHEAQHVFLNTNENDRKPTAPPTRDYRYAKQLKQQFPLHDYQRVAPILKKLRSVKTPYEITVIQQAINITEKTFRRILEFIKPGVGEYEIHAEIMHEFLRNRATGEAYSSILASGESACTLHYVDNNKECKDGEMILMDFGARYGHYNADLTRTVPVSGKFTKRQKAVYEACLRLHKFAKSYLKPGVKIQDYHHQVGVEAGKEMIKLGLLTESDIKNQDPENPAYRKYLYHGISHHLGIDVHDLGPSFFQPIPEGAVLTVEPGIYIAEEKLGIRIENNIWVKESGNVDLMKNIPYEVEEIEHLMRP